jgi:histidinol-phosphate aminotransferase
MKRELSRYVRENILSLAPYSTARDEYKGKLGVFLDANENPYDNGINRYPSTTEKETLREMVASIKKVSVDKLFLGNGSDEAIDLCYRVFCKPSKSNSVMIAPSYGMYEVCAQINDVEIRKIMLTDEFEIDTEAILAATDENTRLIFICSPNNPTGNAFPLGEIEKVVESFDGIVVVDEAYIDFSSQGSAVSLQEKHNNLIVLQTLSKAYGMAGLRIGLAIADPYIISIFKQVKYPYNIGSDTIRLAVDLLQFDRDGEIEEIIEQRDKLIKELEQLQCIKRVYPSDANFLLAKTDNAKALYDHLITKELIVRDRSKTPLCQECLRITIGTPEENEQLIEEIIAYESSR